MTDYFVRHWPVEPVVKELTKRFGATMTSAQAEVLGMSGESWGKRVRRGTIAGDLEADQIACRLGYHPRDLWGDDWFTRIDEGDGLCGSLRRNQSKNSARLERERKVS